MNQGKSKLKIHLLTLPRWFAVPFFGSALAMGVFLAGGSFTNSLSWVALAMGLFIMAGGHSFNSYLDYVWTGLDKGELEERSAEKDYTGGQSVIAQGVCSTREVLYNALGWYVIALIPIIYLSIKTSWMVLPIAVLGMLITFWYVKAKFNWTHELALGTGVGPVAVLLGMFSVNPNPPWVDGLIVSIPFAIILSFAGLALDEWPDAEANLKKGVKSIAYKVWENGVDLSTYLIIWIAFIYIYQVFMISIGLLTPLTGLTFLLVPILIALLVMLKGNFEKFAPWFVLVAAFYPILLVVGQALGG